jgi:glycosyltransferase involved in cell wall biosynthesis
MKKIKVFLGAYINLINAQNLNCRAIARHLDKEKFEVYTLELHSGTFPSEPMNGVNIFRCFYPHKISKYIGYLWGIFHADVVYLPKGEICKWNRFWIKLLRKKSFRTVEGIYGKEMLGQILDSGVSYEEFKNAFHNYDKIFSITKFLGEYNQRHHGIVSEPDPLYLGTDTDLFLNENKKITSLKNIIFIGRLKERKGIFDVLETAREFPEIKFYLAGDGEDKEKINLFIKTEKLSNVSLLGTLTHKELSDRLKTMDLHLFPSRSEGFPKVTLETAAAGVPSVVYPDYGADEWITNGENGFIVQNLEALKELVYKLQKKPEILSEVSKNAIALAKRFDWKTQIREWEKVIKEIYES